MTHEESVLRRPITSLESILSPDVYAAIVGLVLAGDLHQNTRARGWTVEAESAKSDMLTHLDRAKVAAAIKIAKD